VDIAVFEFRTRVRRREIGVERPIPTGGTRGDPRNEVFSCVIEIDVLLFVGVPFDAGVSYRPGARFRKRKFPCSSVVVLRGAVVAPVRVAVAPGSPLFCSSMARP